MTVGGESHEDRASHSAPSIDFKSVATKLEDDLNERFQELFNEVEKGVKGVKEQKSHPLKWLAGAALVLILGLNGFICYQQWQQSQQINTLVEQLENQ